ncbi:VQ motif-containing protein 22-like [Populus alba x Populus x berolinensis]|nr:VQ motif-containing protein 22-like [Populus alba x Populus x berolinensis]
MSGIMSDNPTDWSQFYQHNLSNQVLPPLRPMFRDRAADSTTVTTTTINTSSVQNPMGSSNSSSSAGRHLSPEGRVAKPVRKRSRASRRTPTTLLNTDTTNFRAMVQQFTGGPSAPFASGSQINATNFGFALGAYRQAHHVNQPSPVMMPPAGYNLQYQQQQQQFQQQSQHPSSYMFSLSNSNIGTSTTTTGTTTPGDMFFQRLGNPRPTTSMEVSDQGFGSTEGAIISSLVAPPSRPPSSSSNENRSNTFLF